MADIYVELDGFDMDGDPDGDNIEWHVDEVEGWDSPEVELETAPLGPADGVAVTRHRFNGRPILIKGRAAGPNKGTIEAVRERLGQLAGYSGQEKLLVVHGNQDMQAMVLRAERVRARHVEGSGRRVVDFEIPLLAPDPRKYDTVETVESSAFGPGITDIPAVNEGNMPTHWHVAITGAWDGIVRLKGDPASTDYLYLNADQVGGEELHIESATHRVYTQVGFGGTQYNRFEMIDLSLSEWFLIPPGSTDLRINATGNGMIYWRFRSAWS